MTHFFSSMPLAEDLISYRWMTLEWRKLTIILAGGSAKQFIPLACDFQGGRTFGGKFPYAEAQVKAFKCFVSET